MCMKAQEYSLTSSSFARRPHFAFGPRPPCTESTINPTQIVHGTVEVQDLVGPGGCAIVVQSIERRTLSRDLRIAELDPDTREFS